MNSAIILCKGIKLDRDYRNVLSYSETQLLATCRDNRYRIAEASNYSFIGRDNRIIVNFTWGQCIKANYIAFQNPTYNNKWFFAFIDNVVYKSDEATEIDFTIDAWSTWFNDWQKKPCYIVREHVNNDGIGQNTIQENLDVGRVEAINYVVDEALSNNFGYYIIIGSTWNIGTDTESGQNLFGSLIYSGIVSAEQLFLFQATNLNTIPQAVANMILFITQANTDGHIADIRNVYIVPNFVIEASQLVQHTKTVAGNTCTYYTLNSSVTPIIVEESVPFTTNFSYKPKNNKCYCYPYHYLFVTNQNGNQNVYKYEDFSDPQNPKFEISACLSNGASGMIVPKNYKGQSLNIDEGLALGKYPTIEWNSDGYINWLTQNAVNVPTQLVGLGGNITGKIANGNFSATAGANSSLGQTATNILNVAGNIANLIGSFYSASLLPTIQGGTNTADINFARNRNYPVFYEMKCKDEFMKIIDDYFTRFGYKINRVLEPNIVGRKYWNYLEIAPTETVGNGDVPTEFMNEINNACRSGVTIWHDHESIGNYTLDNSIV